MVPKIESKLETEAIAKLKEISNFIPYALEIKEASDLIMIVKNLYNLVKAYDAYPTPNYSNVGYATGAIAYYCVQMSSGKGMFGFIQINEFNDMSSTDYSLYGAEKSAELLFSVKQAQNMNITEGPEAFQIFFEQFLYSVGNEYVDSAECTSYNNQTDVITEHIYQIDLALNTNNETLLREGLIKANSMLLQEVKDKSSCGIYTNKNVTQILENSIKVLNSTKLNISQDGSFSSEIYLGQAQYTLELHGF
jgi:hypothetical protein